MMENDYANLYRVMVRTKILPESVTLTLGLPEGMFQMADVHEMENTCVKLF